MDLNADGPVVVCDALKEAFLATSSRDYEKAVSVIRAAVLTDQAFGVEDLELIDHVYSCILNTSHYDESVIEVCWEWISALERAPRMTDSRVIASTQLSIYYAYHTISRVQERMPKRPNYRLIRSEAWKRIKKSFDYLWSCAVQMWKPFDLDRLDILVAWSYIALQYADSADDETLDAIETARKQAEQNLSNTIVLENGHQAKQRLLTIERNIKETRSTMEKICRRMNTADDTYVPEAKKIKESHLN